MLLHLMKLKEKGILLIIIIYAFLKLFFFSPSRRNLGKKDDVAPTNYYGYSDDIFATDGSGFNESASDTLWEYAGQTHFG